MGLFVLDLVGNPEDKLSLRLKYVLMFVLLFRGEGSKDEGPFRECFSKLGELRSLCHKAQMVALAATAGPT